MRASRASVQIAGRGNNDVRRCPQSIPRSFEKVVRPRISRIGAENAVAVIFFFSFLLYIQATEFAMKSIALRVRGCVQAEHSLKSLAEETRMSDEVHNRLLQFDGVRNRSLYPNLCPDGKASCEMFGERESAWCVETAVGIVEYAARVLEEDSNVNMEDD